MVLDGTQVVGRRVRAPQLGERPRAGLDVLGADRLPRPGFPVFEHPGDAGGPAHEEGSDVLGVVERRGMVGLDAVPESFEHPRGRLCGGDAVGVAVDLAAGRRGHQPDAQPPGLDVELLAVGALARGCEVWVAGHGRAGRVEDRGAVAHAAAEHVLDRETGEDVPELRAERDAPARGLQPDQAAVAGGDADRAAAVVGVRDGDHARGYRGRGAAA